MSENISLKQINLFLESTRKASAVSDDALREQFRNFEGRILNNAPPDPFSRDYAAYQLDLYEQLSQKKYLSKNEVSNFDVDAALYSPFPFSTRSGSTAGPHLQAVGFLLNIMGNFCGKQILELGAGWGNTAIAFAQLGGHVTATDIEPNFCQLLVDRSALYRVDVNVKCLEFAQLSELGDLYDFVVFHECFHHSADHVVLLRDLHSVLAPGGRVLLSCEPILPDFPVPWGIRTDGESLWAICQNGWLELGFHESYFIEVLRRTGWRATVRRSNDVGWISVWELQRQPLESYNFLGIDESLQSQFESIKDGNSVVITAGRGFVLFGPYVKLARGLWEVEIYYTFNDDCGDIFSVDIVGTKHEERFCRLMSAGLILDAKSERISVLLSLDEDIRDFEVRITSMGVGTFEVRGINIVKLSEYWS